MRQAGRVRVVFGAAGRTRDHRSAHPQRGPAAVLRPILREGKNDEDLTMPEDHFQCRCVH